MIQLNGGNMITIYLANKLQFIMEKFSVDLDKKTNGIV